MLMVGLSGYKWYQSQTLGDVPVSTLGVTIALTIVQTLTSHAGCHNRTYNCANTHFPVITELSQFVLALSMAKRRMLELLVSVQEESLRKRGQREISKERF